MPKRKVIKSEDSPGCQAIQARMTHERLAKFRTTKENAPEEKKDYAERAGKAGAKAKERNRGRANLGKVLNDICKSRGYRDSPGLRFERLFRRLN